MKINKVAVLGSGVMGAQIAAHIANAGCDVVLLDIVSKQSKKRSQLAIDAVNRMIKEQPAPFMHKTNAKKITCGNLEDDLHLISDADWIIEAVIEKCDVKQNIYKLLNDVRKNGSIVSCNPTTMARDIETLVNQKYRIKNLQPIDMFPHTPHIECVTTLILN